MNLILRQEELAICRLDPQAAIPDWLPVSGFTTVTRTEQELSIVCEHKQVPRQVRHSGNWRALEVEGPLAFSEIGILAKLAQVLANARISIFVISSYDTDYVLVRSAALEQALVALRGSGHSIS